MSIALSLNTFNSLGALDWVSELGNTCKIISTPPRIMTKAATIYSEG
jgi:hypothetical protein